MERQKNLRTLCARRPLTAAISLLLASGAMAQELADDADDATLLDQVVVSAAGFEQKLTDAPASISVITFDELQKRPYMTLIDAVRDLEGIDVGETSDKTGQKTISIRGMGADYTLILIDGRRQNNHGDIYPNSFGGNQFNHIPPLDMIERIEVIRGPASTLYGSDALGGVINIITRKVSDRWRGSATLSHNIQEHSQFGSDSTLDFALMGPILGDTLGITLRGARYDRDASNPEYETVYDPNGEAHERTLGFGGGGKTVDNTNRTLGVTLAWRPTERQDVSLDLDRSEQVYDNRPYINNLGTLTYPLGTVDSIETIWRASGGHVQPRVGYVDEQEFTRDQWAISHHGDWNFGESFVSLSHIESANNGRTLPFSVAERQLLQQMWDGTGPFADMDVEERRALAESTFLPRPGRVMESRQYTLDAKVDFPITLDNGGMHHVVVGGQIIDGELEDGVFGMENGGYGNGTVQDHEMWSLFTEDNWSVNDRLTLTAGVRHDDHNVFGGHTSPRVYGLYTLGDTWAVKGGISTGYKTPDTTDLYDGITGFGGQGTIPFVGNPDLQPETSVNSEIAVYWTSLDGDHNFNLTVFHNDFRDKIAQGEVTQSCETTGGVRPCANLGDFAQLGYTTFAQYVNIDEARIQGVELAGRWQISDTWALRGNYTYTDSEQKTGPDAGLPLTQTARHMANATLEWLATDRLTAQLIAEARSRRYRGSTDEDGNPLYFRAYEVLHLAAQYRLNDHVTFSARVNNLLDEDFTSYRTVFTQNPDGSYTMTALDDYNNKDKGRNLWLSVHVRF